MTYKVHAAPRARTRVYDFSISVDADGRPRIREFGNVQKCHYGPRALKSGSKANR